MVEKRFLVKATNWTLERPQFIAAVDEAMAAQVSQSLSFNMQDYMLHANR